jgi:uncharacterized cupredoxin-like copper-binding protein
VLAALAVAAGVGLSGCASHTPSASGTRVVVVERDFELTASETSVPAGMVTLHIVNHGPSTHEFVVDETFYTADKLPLERNGVQVNEAATTLRTADQVSVIRVGTERDLTMQLKPGHYVIFCNFEGHYQGGMRVGFNVTA